MLRTIFDEALTENKPPHDGAVALRSGNLRLRESADPRGVVRGRGWYSSPLPHTAAADNTRALVQPVPRTHSTATGWCPVNELRSFRLEEKKMVAPDSAVLRFALPPGLDFLGRVGVGPRAGHFFFIFDRRSKPVPQKTASDTIKP